MKTKGANLLLTALSTMLIAGVATPSFALEADANVNRTAADTTAETDANSSDSDKAKSDATSAANSDRSDNANSTASETKSTPESESKADSAKTMTKSAIDPAKEPKEPTAEDTTKIGKDRGIIITEINPPKGNKATTAEIKGKTTPTIKRVSTAGNDVFTRGLVIETQPSKVEKVNQNLLIKPPAKPAAQAKNTAVIKSSSSSQLMLNKTSNQAASKTTAKSETKNAAAETAKSNKNASSETAKSTKKNAATETAKSAPNSPSSNETATSVIKGAHPAATKTHKPSMTVVAPTNSGEQIVTAWLNKSGQKPHYSNGEKLQVNVAANKDCNLMIFNYDGQQLTQLYPNEYQPSPLVRAGQTIAVGGDSFQFDFTASNNSTKPSHEKIFVYAYPIESDNSPISVAMMPVPSSPFRATDMTPEKYREMVNKSQVFFGRKVSVTAKKAEVEEVQLASYSEPTSQGGAANKIELSLVIDGVRRN